MATSDSAVKEEVETFSTPVNISRSGNIATAPLVVIDLSSSDSGWSSDEEEEENNGGLGVKKRRLNESLPVGFLEPLPPDEDIPEPISMSRPNLMQVAATKGLAQSRQFWKAGDYEGDSVGRDSRAALIGRVVFFVMDDFIFEFFGKKKFENPRQQFFGKKICFFTHC